MPSLLLVFAPFPAHAYIDPGTGSLIIQAIVAALAGLLLYIKLYWHKIKNIFSKKDSASDQGVEKPKSNNE
jgi:hypothetical protein